VDRPIKTLERVLSKAGLASRTVARKMIVKGRVQVNGVFIRDPDTWVDLELDKVSVDGKPLQVAEPVYLLLHKPTGYLATHRDKDGRATVYDLLPPEMQYVSSVGRLDLETSGLLILTNDTQLAERLTNPKFKVPKTYLVKASIPLTEEHLELLRSGIELKEGPTLPAEVSRVPDIADPHVFEITITEGRNRQVRRMVEALEGEVLELVRTRIGEIEIGELEIGKTRALTAEEIAGLTS